MSDIAWNRELYEPRDSGPHVDAERNTVADPRLFRNALGSFATGVIAATYASAGRNYGVTVNSFTSVSLEPPLVLVSLMRTSRALNYLLERPFAINVLASDQLETALHFAGKPQESEPIWVTDESAPRLAGAMAYFQCTPWAAYDGGDHVLVLGRVLSHGEEPAAQPLVFQRGRWTELVQPNPDVKESA